MILFAICLCGSFGFYDKKRTFFPTEQKGKKNLVCRIVFSDFLIKNDRALRNAPCCFSLGVRDKHELIHAI